MGNRFPSSAFLGTGLVLGAAIWWLSPWITGHAEPWDDGRPWWTISWAVVAIAGGASGRARGALLPVGVALGQMLVTIRSVTGEFGVLGWLFIGAFGAGATLGALAIAGLVSIVARLRHNPPR